MSLSESESTNESVKMTRKLLKYSKLYIKYELH